MQVGEQVQRTADPRADPSDDHDGQEAIAHADGNAILAKVARRPQRGQGHPQSEPGREPAGGQEEKRL